MPSENESGTIRQRRAKGEGSIRRRTDGRFEGQVRLTLLDGQQVRRSVYGKSRQEVSRKLSQIRRQHEEGSLSATSRDITTKGYLDSWWSAETLKPKSLDARRLSVARITSVIGGVPLKKLTPSHVKAVDDALRERHLSGASRKQTFAVFKKAMRDAVVQGLIAVSPFDRVTWQPNVEHKEIHALRPDELASLLSVDDEWQPLWVVLIGTGLRSGECLGLTWDNVDLVANRLHVTQSLQFATGGFRFTTPKTKKSRRTVLFGEEVRSAFLKIKRNQTEHQLKAGAEWHNDHNLVFTSPWGTPVHASTAWKALRRTTERIELDNLRVHDLRHNFATHQLLAGTPVKVVSEALGHSSIAVTLDTYSHVLPTMQHEAAGVMDEVLKAAKSAG